ncbi:MAG: hypothetical protein R3B06_31850 [Kofleriaceae bacterium]
MLRRLVIAAAMCTGLSACITPSIPIPPPEPALMTFDLDVAAGAGTFSYRAEPNYANAVVYVYNRTAGTGVIATARVDGSVGPTAAFPARVGDNVAVTFETDEASASTCVVVRAGAPSSVDYCTQ